MTVIIQSVIVGGIARPAEPLTNYPNVVQWRSNGSEYVGYEEGEEAPAPDLTARRAAKWAEIKAHRDRLSDEGGYSVTVGGVTKWFHSNLKSQTQQICLVLAGANVPPVPWKTMDGTFVTMSPQWAAAIYQAAMAKEAAIFAVAEAHRAAMEALPNPEAYDFSGGWPQAFGG